MARHGTNAAYSSGCKCRLCKAAHAAQKRWLKADAAVRLAEDPSLAEHGLESTYVYWCCRCRACKAAHAQVMRDLRERRVERLAADPTLVPHGRSSTYGNWGCRCRPCTDAWTVSTRKVRANA